MSSGLQGAFFFSSSHERCVSGVTASLRSCNANKLEIFGLHTDKLRQILAGHLIKCFYIFIASLLLDGEDTYSKIAATRLSSLRICSF